MPPVVRDETGWGGEAKEAFASARDPAYLDRAVVRFHQRIDDVMQATVSGHSIALACRRGCAHCCHLRVEVTPHEAFALAAWLRRHLAAERLAQVLEKLRANARQTREMGAERRKRTNLACALLDANGECTAYAARPAQCRRYHSVRLETCVAFHRNPADESLETPMHPVLAHNAAVIITQAQHAVREAGLGADNEDLTLALLAALDNPGSLRRWRDGKKPFPPPR